MAPYTDEVNKHVISRFRTESSLGRSGEESRPQVSGTRGKLAPASPDRKKSGREDSQAPLN